MSVGMVGKHARRGIDPYVEHPTVLDQLDQLTMIESRNSRDVSSRRFSAWACGGGGTDCQKFSFSLPIIIDVRYRSWNWNKFGIPNRLDTGHWLGPAAGLSWFGTGQGQCSPIVCAAASSEKESILGGDWNIFC